MKKIYYLVLPLFFSLFFVATPAGAETQVSGEVRYSTTWTKANSPYVLIRTVEIPKTVTLTIEPGVTVSMPGGFDMFSVKGKIVALGTAAEKIVFDGGGNSTLFNALGSTNLAFADLDYCEIKNGLALWKNGIGSFSLRHSIVENLAQASTIVNPADDIYIEYNEFKNASGFTVKQGASNKVYIRHNLFNGKNSALSSLEDFLIQNIMSFEDSETILENNSFLNISGTAVALADGEASAKLNAGGNYWGTTDTAVIDAMIYDRSDSSAVVGLINYQPILAAPHPDTPDIARPDAPQIDPVTTPTDSAAQTISGTKPADTSVWLNGEEVAALSADTLWSYSFALLLGENNISVTVKDQSGEASPPATTVILRVEAVCASWTYSDWSACADGVQSRTVLTSAPAGCAGGAPVLSQSCSAGILEDVVLEEKNLVKTVSSGLSSRLSGRILLQVERSGEAWYVYPADKKKYYLGRPADAFNVMRRLGLGATHGFISGQTIFPSHVLGKILLDVEKNGEAYYINPGDKKAYYLGRPLDAFRLMRELGLGITNADIRQISVGNIN